MSKLVLGRCRVCGFQADLEVHDFPPTPCPNCLAHWLLDQGVPRLEEYEEEGQ